MLIVDYVFGGSTYSETTDIINNVGSHDIFFTFIFEGEKYTNNDTHTIYDIYLNCFYLLDVGFVDILFNRKPEAIYDSYCFEIRAENGIITALKDFGKITDSV